MSAIFTLEITLAMSILGSLFIQRIEIPQMYAHIALFVLHFNLGYFFDQSSMSCSQPSTLKIITDVICLCNMNI
jgi:hypothetical protein